MHGHGHGQLWLWLSIPHVSLPCHASTRPFFPLRVPWAEWSFAASLDSHVLKRSRWATPGASGEREVDRPRPHRSATEAAKHHPTSARSLSLPPSSARRQRPRGEAHRTRRKRQAPTTARAPVCTRRRRPRKVRSVARPRPHSLFLHHGFVVGLSLFLVGLPGHGRHVAVPPDKL